MSNVTFEDWLEMSDEERGQASQSWNLGNGDGKEFANKAADLLKRECIYNLLEIDTAESDNSWCIQAYMDTFDYEKLKDRETEKFLGFKISFHNIEDFNK
ncbi:MAG: hypothetical protein OEY68_05585 [Gammaproteobacteria bacterium]|nr:hypothetical protein [Gammaproteobacteria bacterium]